MSEANFRLDGLTERLLPQHRPPRTTPPTARPPPPPGAVEPPAAAVVVSIRFDQVGGRTGAVISPASAGVTILYTVSGTDKYYDSRRLRTDASGSVSFGLP